MDITYFSDKENGEAPRIHEEINKTTWDGISSLIETLIDKGAFGKEFPDVCPDGGSQTFGTNKTTFSKRVAGEIPSLAWPVKTDSLPNTLAILDFIQFCIKYVAEPIQGASHQFYSHHHLTFDISAGQKSFLADINRIFSRNGLVFELQSDGQIIRLPPTILRESLQNAIFKTKDTELNTILEDARKKFLNPDPKVRKESLEKLWDGWERLKTLSDGKDKKESTAKILEKASPDPNFKARLNKEGTELTEIGNNFLIRHKEVTQVSIQESAHVDYLFHRLFAFVTLLLPHIE